MIYLKKKTIPLGLFSLLFILVIGSDFTFDQKLFLSIFNLTVYFWLFTTIPLFVSGLLGVSLCIILDLAPASEVFANFSHPIILLFLGGFLLAKAFARVGLDRRISLYLLSRDFIKGSPTRLLFTLMFLTATFSMWVSNTATTAMMLPLTLGVIDGLKIEDRKITSLILLCIAYSSNIGGIATPIGSTPNIIALGMLEEFASIEISFLEWMIYTLPMATIFLACLFLLSIKQLKKASIKVQTKLIEEKFNELSPISKAEKTTLTIFLLTVCLWLLPSFIKLFGVSLPIQLNPGAVATFGASLLFVTPFNDSRKILDPKAISTIDWSSLLLFGSGLALGSLLFKLELADMAGRSLQGPVSDLPPILTLFFIFILVIFATELTSNTATANIILPIIISLAIELKLSPLLMAMGVSIACSMAFMLPVATPPNAIIYGSGKVSRHDMMKLGLGLNLIISVLLAIIIWVYLSLAD